MNVSVLSGFHAALCDHLREGIVLAQEHEDVRIHLPITDPYGDPLSFVVEDGVDSSAYITDGGRVFHYVLGEFGHASPGSEIWRRVAEVAARYGLAFDGGEMNGRVDTITDLASRVVTLSAAVSEAFGIVRAAAAPVSIRFDEEVGDFLSQHEIPYEANAKIIGSSSATHRVDFVLPNSRQIVAQAIASEASMRRSLNIFYDLTEQTREFIPVAFVDEERHGYSNVTYNQLSYKANVFLWGQRGQFLEYWQRAHDRQSRDDDSGTLEYTS